jgi:DnaJ-class molecular chaperone
MKDPYRVLHVPRDADQAVIKQAYRKLAKALHPDRNPGSERAEQRFKEVTEAYDLLSDPAKRAKFDRGEIDASGRRRHPFERFEYAGDPRTAEGIFGKMFGGAFGRGFGQGPRKGSAEFRFDDLRQRAERAAGASAREARRRGTDRHFRLEVDFLTAAHGGRQRLELGRNRAVEVAIPAGAAQGDVLRLKGQGEAGAFGGTPGDALVEIAVRPHPLFTRKGQDLHIELPISVPEAVLGASIAVPTIDGPVRMTVPAGSNSGRTLRLKGKGIGVPGSQRGDQYVRLLVMLPEAGDAELERWAKGRSYDVRRDQESR